MALLPSKRQRAASPITALRSEMNRLFEDFFGRDFFVEPFRDLAGWNPALDVAENDTAVIVKAELPGLDPDDVEISLTADVLTIKGEKKEEKEEKDKNYHCVERTYGSFQRSLRLPAPVKADDVEAAYKNGVLTITLPKREESKPKSVKINLAK